MTPGASNEVPANLLKWEELRMNNDLHRPKLVSATTKVDARRTLSGLFGLELDCFYSNDTAFKGGVVTLRRNGNRNFDAGLVTGTYWLQHQKELGLETRLDPR